MRVVVEHANCYVSNKKLITNKTMARKYYFEMLEKLAKKDGKTAEEKESRLEAFAEKILSKQS